MTDAITDMTDAAGQTRTAVVLARGLGTRMRTEGPAGSDLTSQQAAAAACEVDLAAVRPGDALHVLGEGGKIAGAEYALLQLRVTFGGEAVGALNHDELAVPGHDTA